MGSADRLRIGNSSSATGDFHIDTFLVSAQAELDCWNLLAGTCSVTTAERCIDDADCPAGESCQGVNESYPAGQQPQD